MQYVVFHAAVSLEANFGIQVHDPAHAMEQ